MSRCAILIVLICCAVSLADSKTLTVAADGSGDFKTVQEAITASPDGGAVIHIKPGTYQGPFVVPKNKPNITLQGDDAATTILTYDRNVFEDRPPGADKFNPGLQVVGDNFRAQNLTIQNTSGDHGQALAMRIDSDRNIIKNCRIIGWQDTLMANNGRDYFVDCYIAGRVDFIYGSATAWFENCEIHSRNGGHVTAASTPEDHPFGFVFNKCHLTGDKIAWQPPATGPASTQPIKPYALGDLGRPWRPFASVTYLNCVIEDHIRPQGWNNWGKTENEKTARYSEYNSSGPGANPEKRFAWTKQLTKDEADKITVEAVLSGADVWKPN